MFKDLKELYYSIVTLGGLLLIVIATVSLFQLLLSTYVLGIKEDNYRMQPPDLKGYVGDVKGKDLTQDQKQAIENWEKDYENWKNENKETDWNNNMKKQQLAMSLSFLFVGVPIFLYHRRFLQKDL